MPGPPGNVCNIVFFFLTKLQKAISCEVHAECFFFVIASDNSFSNKLRISNLLEFFFII